MTQNLPPTLSGLPCHQSEGPGPGIPSDSKFHESEIPLGYGFVYPPAEVDQRCPKTTANTGSRQGMPSGRKRFVRRRCRVHS